MADWRKDLPNPLVIVDKWGREHKCSLQLVGLDGFSGRCRLEYYDWGGDGDDKIVYLSAYGETEEEATERMLQELSKL